MQSLATPTNIFLKHALNYFVNRVKMAGLIKSLNEIRGISLSQVHANLVDTPTRYLPRLEEGPDPPLFMECKSHSVQVISHSGWCGKSLPYPSYATEICSLSIYHPDYLPGVCKQRTGLLDWTHL